MGRAIRILTRLLLGLSFVVVLMIGFRFYEMGSMMARLQQPALGQTIGSADAPYVLVEFLDYRCGDCRDAHPAVTAFLRRHPDVRLVVAPFPVLGTESVSVAKFALAAAQQGKFAQVHEALITHEDFSPEALDLVARSLGLDKVKLEEDSIGQDVDSVLLFNKDAASFFHIYSTPAFMFNKDAFYAPEDYVPTVDDLEKFWALAKARAGQ